MDHGPVTTEPCTTNIAHAYTHLARKTEESNTKRLSFSLEIHGYKRSRHPRRALPVHLLLQLAVVIALLAAADSHGWRSTLRGNLAVDAALERTSVARR